MTNFIKEELETIKKEVVEAGYVWNKIGEELNPILEKAVVASHLRLLERVVGIVDKITVTPQNKYDKEDLEKAQLINEYLLPAVKTKLINELKSIE